MSKTRLTNSKLPVDVYHSVCEYDKCIKCMKMIETMEGLDERKTLDFNSKQSAKKL